MEIKATFNDRGLVKKYGVLPQELDLAVRRATAAVMATARNELTGKQGLSMFPIHKKGTPTPSPSDGSAPPAQVTTNLRRTISKTSVTRVGFGRYQAQIYPTASYALAQEKGTATIPARPYVAPARARTADKAHKIFNDYLQKALTKNGG